jgi:hypothetical protein
VVLVFKSYLIREIWDSELSYEACLLADWSLLDYSNVNKYGDKWNCLKDITLVFNGNIVRAFKYYALLGVNERLLLLCLSLLEPIPISSV